MASTTLFLKTPNSPTTSKVAVRLRDGRDISLVLSSDYSIKPKHWSKVKKHVLSSNSNSIEINKNISQFKDDVLTAYLTLSKITTKITTLLLKEEVSKIQKEREIQRNPELHKKTLPTFWELWDEKEKQSVGNANRTRIAIKTVKNKLLEFEKNYKFTLQTNKINAKRLSQFRLYCYEVCEMNIQTTAKYISTIKAFLNWCFENDHIDNQDFKKFKQDSPPENLKVILTKSDMDKIKSLDLTYSDKLNNARAFLILSTYTGFRYSDFSTLKSNHLYDNNGIVSLKKVITKTKEEISIPLTKEAEKIVKGIINGMYHTISNQKLNTYFKEICELAEIDDLYEVQESKGGIVKIINKPKYSLIETHTGRRTFATNLLLKGVPIETVMLYTGHKKYESFKKYVNIPKHSQDHQILNALED